MVLFSQLADVRINGEALMSDGDKQTRMEGSRAVARGPRLSVLLYHRVGPLVPESEHLSLNVTPARFRRQVRWLRWRGYTGISPEQWLAARTSGGALPKKPILFTFDDAYDDTALHAFPVLEQAGFRSVVFVITRQMGGVTAWDGLRMMSLEEVRYWSTRGVEIGAHTQNHPDLTAIAEDSVALELTGSRDDLQREGFAACSFAYPYGAFDERVHAATARVFPLAFTCEEGRNDFATDSARLKRTMVHPGDTLLDVECRAALGSSPLDWWRKHVRLRTRLRGMLGLSRRR